MREGGWTELFAAGRGRVLVFCWLGWVFDFYDLILFAFLRSAVASDLGLGVKTDLAWLQGLTLGATAVGGFVFGRLADRFGRRRAITASILVYSIGAFGTAAATGWWSLLAARVVTGLGVGGEWGIGHAIVAETYPPRLRGRAAGVLQAGSPIAMALAAVMASFSGLGWRQLYLLAGVPAALVFLARWAMPLALQQPTASRVPIASLFRGSLRRASTTILLLLALHMTGFWCTYAWLPQQLIQEYAQGPSQHLSVPAFVGWFFLCLNSVHVLADVAFGFVADRFGRRRTFTAFCLVFAAGLLLLASGYQPLRRSWWSFTAAFALVGLGAGTWSCFGVLFAENYPPALRATAAAGFYSLARGMQLVTQPVMGVLFVWTGTFAVALVVGAVTAALSAVVIWAVPAAEVRDAAFERPPADRRPQTSRPESV